MMNWLKTAFRKLSGSTPKLPESEHYSVIEGTLFMTAEQSADWIKKNGTQSNIELNALAASAMEADMLERKRKFDAGESLEGDWVKTISASTAPDLSKVNQAYAIRRIKSD